MLSIIVPVYNAYEYLTRTLDSVLNQTLKDWECLLINDGSTDNSLSICEDYSARDKRFKVISQANAGVSAARNRGLSLAEGEYIAFLDADDVINPIMYEQLILALSTYGVEAVSCGYVSEKAPQLKLNQRINFNLLRRPIDFFYDDSKAISALWNKVFCKDVLKGLQFDTDIRYSEDQLFVLEVLARIEAIAITEAVFYHYIDYEISATKKQGSYELWEGYVRATEMMYEQMLLSKCSEKAVELSFIRIGRSVFSLLRLAIQKQDREAYIKYRQRYNSIIVKLLQSRKLSLGSWFTYWTYWHSYELANLIHYRFKQK